MAHVEGAGDVGGRGNERIGRLIGVGVGDEEVFVDPARGPVGLEAAGLVDFVELDGVG
jgi:hypothetical protein